MTVNLFVSVPFGMERYEFHLNVYNQYKVLKDVEKIELGPGEKQYLVKAKKNHQIRGN